MRGGGIFLSHEGGGSEEVLFIEGFPKKCVCDEVQINQESNFVNIYLKQIAYEYFIFCIQGGHTI